MSTSSTTPYFPTTVEQNRARNEARARELGLPTNVEEATPNSGNEDNPSLPTGLDSQRQGIEPRLTAEEQIVREAILDIFNSRHPDKPRFFFEGQHVLCASGCYETVSEALANIERLDFANAVIARARKIKQVDEADRLEKRRINDPD